MEFTQLKYFRTAAKFNHFSRAAAELHITQSALSKSISQLEGELGYQLFDREGKKLRLNPYGEALLAFSDRIFQQFEDFTEQMRAMTDEDSGKISVALSFFDCDPSAFITCFKEFMIKYPRISLFKYQQNTEDIITNIRNRTIDVGISAFPVESLGIRWEPLYTDRIGIQVSKTHPLAQRKGVAIVELREERFITTSATPGLTDMTQTLCSFEGFTPKVVFNSCNPLYNSELISRGYGISFLAESRFQAIMGGNKGAIDQWSNMYAFIPLTDTVAQITIGLFYAENRSLPPATKRFILFLREQLKNQ